MRRSSIVSALLSSGLLFLGACAGETATDESADEVVGGRAEDGFPAVGYLATDEKGALAGPECGATLLAPDLAVTAAHCILDGVGYGFGYGKKGEHAIIAARAVYVSPSYDGEWVGPHDEWNDVAILRLAKRVPKAKIIAIGTGSKGNATFVGYGRVTEGTADITDGFTGERKSADFRVTKTLSTELYATGVDGGNCWGDSGGALIQDEKLVGVLSRFDVKNEEEDILCKKGNRMIYTRLSGVAEFIEKAKACKVDVVGDLPVECGGESP